jgi:hypothetical protein
MEEMAKTIITHEFPWPELSDCISSSLQDLRTVYAGLTLLHHIAKLFETEMGENRSKLSPIIDLYFPTLIVKLEEFIAYANDDAYKHCEKILNTFWSAFYLEIPPAFAKKECLGRWLACFRQLLLISPVYSPEILHTDYEKHPLWDCKRLAIQIVHRIFSRYFNRIYMKEHNSFICEYFQKEWANQFFLIIIKQLSPTEKKFISDPVMNFYLKYMTQAVKCETVIPNITQRIAVMILVDICLPLLQRNETDDDLWQNNEIEFIRREEDLLKAYYSKKNSAIVLINVLCEKKYLLGYLKYLRTELDKFPDWRRKEAFLLSFGALSDQIKSVPQSKDNAECILSQFVFSDFSSQNPYLRFRAPWVCSRFSHISLPNSSFQEHIFQSLCVLMTDSSLPIRYSASIALPRVLHWEVSKAKLKSEIQPLLQIYLQLMNEVQSEDVIESLESIVSAFPAEVQPFAIELAQYLVSSFVENEENKGQDEGNTTGVSMLNALMKILEVFTQRQDGIMAMSFLIQPALEVSLSSSLYFEEGLNLLNAMLYNGEDESLPHLFKFFEKLVTALVGKVGGKGFAIQFCEDIFPPIGNFIRKYPRQMEGCMVGIFEMVFHLLGQEDEDEIFLSCQIMLAILENYQASDYVTGNVSMVIQQFYQAFQMKLAKRHKIACSQVIFMSIWNSPQQASQFAPVIIEIVDFALTAIKHYLESLARVHLIFGLGSLFLTSLPSSLHPHLCVFLQAMLMCAYDREMDGPQHQTLTSTVNVTLNINTSDDWREEDSSDDDDYPFGIEPTNYYDSKFESADYVHFIQQVLRGLNPAALSSLTTALPEREQRTAKFILERE